MLNKNKWVYKQGAAPETAGIKALLKITTNPHRLIQPLLNLYIHFSKEKLSSKLLIILFFTLPWNLGKHFENAQSFINERSLNYLIPTIYLQDVFVVVILVLWMASVVKSIVTPKLKEVFKGDAAVTRLLFLFLVAVFLSVFFAGRFYPSAYFFARLLLYFLFFITSINLFHSLSVRRWFFVSLVVNVLLLSALGFLQFYKQSSVFNNYLFFGEQPYNVFTPFIAKESFNGVAKIPPYATFLHPNIFAGYLVVSLTLSLGYLFGLKRCRLFLSGVFVLLCSFLLFLTKSYIAWVAFVLGALLLSFVRLVFIRHTRNARLTSSPFLFLALAIVLLGLLFPFYKTRVVMLLPGDSVTSTLSVERRSALLKASYKMILQKPFFGWGINSFTYSFEPFYSRQNVVRFLQPVHNVYALVAAEVGVFGALFFISTALYAVYCTARRGGSLYSVALIQIAALSSFDHYFFTIPQMQLLFILTLMMGLTYTKDTNCL